MLIIKALYRFFLFFLFILVLAVPGWSQEQFNSEKDLISKAEELFEEEDYRTAMPLFSQLLSLYPKDPNYNYKFGVCILFAETDKENPLKYLQNASKKEKVDPEVFFFLGKAYHLNYKFDNAILNYEKYKKIGSSKNISKLKVDHHIEMAKNGKKLLKNVTELVVLEKKETDEKEFFRAYELADFGNASDGSKKSFGGKLLVKPEEFQTSFDKKKKEKSIFFLPSNTDIVYYSSFGDDGKNGREIYSIKRLPDGNWAEPKNIGAPINTGFDEDYPFMHPDGTLYFCSRGHNSMGGYDVFKTVLNPETGQWTTPVNLDFAINTPDDDFLYIPDGDMEMAYFASKRSSVSGKTHVYKIKVDRRPFELAILKGTTKINPIPSGILKVYSEDKKFNVGEFRINQTNGNYLVNLPGPGNYKFTMEAEGFSPITQNINIPKQDELFPYRQELILKESGGGKILAFENYFDKPSEGVEELFSEAIKNTSLLEVNVTPQDLNPVVKTEEIPAPINSLPVTSDAITPETTVAPAKTLSNADLINIAREDARGLEEEVKELNQKSDLAIQVSVEKDKLAREKLKEAESIKAGAKNSSDPNSMAMANEQVTQLEKESRGLAEEAIFAYNLAMDLDKEFLSRKEEANAASQYANDIEGAINSNSTDAINKLNDQRKALESTENKDAVESAVSELRSKADLKIAEAEKAEARSVSLTKSLKDINDERSGLIKSSETTKNEQAKNEMLLQAKELDVEYQKTQIQAENEYLKSVLLKEESAALNKQALIAEDLINRIRSGESVSEISTEEKKNLEASIAGYKSENNVKPGEEPQNVEPAGDLPPEEVYAQLNKQPIIENAVFENKIRTISSKTDPVARENKKVEVYNDWANELDRKIEIEKLNLKNINDPNDRARAEERINLIKEESAGKRSNASYASRLLEQYKTAGSDPIARKQASEEIYNARLNEAEAIKDPRTKDLQKALIYNEWSNDINNAYQANKVLIESTPNEEERKTFEMKDEALRMEFEEKKKTADENSVRAGITPLQIDPGPSAISTNALPSPTSQGTEPAVEIAITNPQVIENSNISSDPASPKSVDQIELELTQAESLPSELEREQARAGLYNTWAGNIKNDIDLAKQQETNAATPEEKDLVGLKISLLELQFNEKKDLATLSEKKVATLTTGGNTIPVVQNEISGSNELPLAKAAEPVPADSITSSSSESVSNEPLIQKTDITPGQTTSPTSAIQAPDESAGINTPPVQTAAVINTAPPKDTLKLAGINIDIAYSNKESIGLVKEANLKMEEGMDLSNQSKELRTQAGSVKDEGEKLMLLSKAVKLQGSGEEVKIEAQKDLAAANEKEYKDNEAKLQQRTAEKNQSNEASLAELLNDESKYFYNEANKKRVQAENTSAFKAKEDLLRQALKNEKTAIEKQQKAIDLYNKSGAPLLVQQQQSDKPAFKTSPAEPSITQPVVATTNNTIANNNNDNTNIPVSQNEALPAIIQPSEQAKPEETAPAPRELVVDGFNYSKLQYKSTGKGQNDSLVSMANDIQKLQDEKSTVEDFAKKDSLSKLVLAKQVELNKLLAGMNDQEIVSNKGKLESLVTANPSVTSSVDSVNNELFRASVLRGSISSETTSTAKLQIMQEAYNAEISAIGIQERALQNFGAPIGSLAINPVSVSDSSQNNLPQTNVNQLPAQVENTIVENNNSPAINNEPVVGKQDPSPAIQPVNTIAENTNSPASSAVLSEAMTQEEIDQIRQRSEYNAFYRNLKQKDSITLATSQAYTALEKNNEEKNLKNQSLEFEKTKTNPDTFLVNQIEGVIRLKQNTGDSIRSLISKLENDFKREESKPDSIFISTDQDTREKIRFIAIAESRGQTITPKPVSAPVEAIPVAVKTEVITNEPGASAPGGFDKNELELLVENGKPPVAIYGPANPIPIDSKLPEGLIYKVQIGAFRNPIPADHFKGFKPLNGESTNIGFTRYTAGIFKSIETANSAKNKIREIGYKDAFVVAFLNGKRISVNEALNRSGASGPADLAGNSQTPVKAENFDNTKANTNQANSASAADIAPATDLATTSGLNYTVQVGVYSNPVPASRLFNIQPLFTEKMQNGNLRYTSGLYSNVINANQAKNKIVDLGIKDAFVIAFSNGKPISMDQAALIINQRGGNVINQSDVVDVQPEVLVNKETKPINPPTNNNNPAVQDLPGVFYKIQIGAFREEVPVKIAEQFLKISNKGVKFMKDAEGLTIYTVGALQDYQAASDLKNELIAQGLLDCFIVAYNNNVKITLEEAKELLGK